MSAGTLVLLLLSFFGSGASALVYQVLWHRQLSLVLGVTVYATTTVLAAFMTGLAIGSAVGGRLSDRLRSPLLAFGLVEIAIGVTAYATQGILGGVAGAYPAVSGVLPAGFGVATLVRFLCAMAVLVIPTVLMGMTFPLILKGSASDATATHRHIGWFYASNTTGAVTGALVTGFVLVGTIGMRASFAVAAVINILVGTGTILLTRRLSTHRHVDRVSVPSSADAGAADPSGSARQGMPRRVPRIGLAVFALSGLAALALEVIWFRLLVYFVPATTYAFTTMLASVLLGLALGSWLVSSLTARPRDWTTVLATLQIATALCIPLVVTALTWAYASGARTTGDWHVSLLIALPPTVLMGMAYPVGLRVWAAASDARSDLDGSCVGDLNAANLGGGIVGAVLGGFVVLPWLGTRLALGTFASVYVVAFLLMLSLLPLSTRKRLALAAGTIATFLIVATSAPDVIERVSPRRYPPGERLIWREEGLQTTAAVHVRPLNNHILYLDGLHQASDRPEMVRLHRLIGHLPMALHASPNRALVVGMGGGVTPGAVSQHGGQVDLVELSRAVTNAGPWFQHVNYDVLRQPNVRLHVDDGRNYLLMANRRYDVVTADLIQPEHAGAGNLYSREYFSLVRQAMSDDGLVMQWLGHRRDVEYKLILRTFLDVFPNTTLWADGQLMVGSVGPLRIDRAAFEAKLARAEGRAALAEIDLDRFENLLALYTAGPDELRAFVGDGPLLLDDRPRVEYFRSLPDEASSAMVDIRALHGDVTRHLVAAP